ncbi:MAG: 3',5'-cyclic-nucleotide phosphodiesterase [Desulfobacterota bacterium]|nr:3',5'-cyclic-nucleotide phosphodiesterase [Thermodesulfobacteriota bacterium]MDW8001190.1 3',5'-cyclic-nucleotide phosphodiesterase [Deltaproteobacteria bacterium]
MIVVKIEILGCYGGVVGRYRTTSFLINDAILIDAGTITEVLSYERIKKLKAVFISHAHLDHIKGLFPLVDELAALKAKGISVFSAKPTIEVITKNGFNDLIWPDFTSIPSAEDALIRFQEIPIDSEFEFEGLMIKAIPVSHTVYTTGFVVKEKEKKGFMFTSDTKDTERIWEVAKDDEIEFVIADVSFPESERKVAELSCHMTLSMLLSVLDRYGLTKKPTYIYHMKPYFIKAIKKEVLDSKRKNLRFLRQGMVIEI